MDLFLRAQEEGRRNGQEGWCWGRDGCPWELTRPHLPSLRQLLSYITKDKQTESLVEKLCPRFRTARYAAVPLGRP